MSAAPAVIGPERPLACPAVQTRTRWRRVLPESGNQLDGGDDRCVDRKHQRHEACFRLRQGGFQLCRSDFQFRARDGLPGIRSHSACHGNRFNLASVRADNFQFPDGNGGVACVAREGKAVRVGSNAHPVPARNAPGPERAVRQTGGRFPSHDAGAAGAQAAARPALPSPGTDSAGKPADPKGETR